MRHARLSLVAVLLLSACASDPPPGETKPPAPPPERAPEAAPARPVVTGGHGKAAPAKEAPLDPDVIAAGNRVRVLLRTGRDVEGTSVGMRGDELILTRPDGILRLHRAQIESVTKVELP